jgi:PAS domain S-box-containing protein
MESTDNNNTAIANGGRADLVAVQSPKEAALRQSEACFRWIFQNGAVGMATAGSDWRFIKANDSFCRMTGYSEQELASLTFSDITHPEDLAANTDGINELLSGHITNYRNEKRYITKSGDTLWASVIISAVRDEKGNFLYFLGMVEDITERKRAEEQLLDSEARFRKIFEDGPVGMVMVGADMRFIRANQTFCRMTGYSENELTSLTFKDVTHPEHVTADVGAVNKLLNGEIPLYKTEKRYIRKDGSILWGSLTVSTIRDTTGNFLYFLSMINDITEHKRVEIELERTNKELKERDRLKNEFVSTVTHELRTPLCVFKNIISNALAGVAGPLNPKLRKNLEMATQNIDRLSRIVNDFLDVARIEAGRVKLAVMRVDICTIIREVVEAFAPVAMSKKISLDTVIPDINVVIEGDRDKIIQVLTNLVGNAVKYIEPGSHILVTLCDRNEYISVSVHDDGPGIEPKYLDKLFNRFQLGATTVRSGQPSSGLGLTISKEFVEMHQGQIWAESVFGHGSTFTFTLPKTQAAKNCLSAVDCR